MTELTQREKQIVLARARGETTKVIAANLGIAMPTVDFHLAALKRKHGILTMAHAAHYAIARLGAPLMFLFCAVCYGQVPAISLPPITYPGITLAWDKVSDTNVVAYWVSWGVKTRTYTNSINVGTNLTYTFDSLLPNVLYYFAAQSADKTGNLSDFSNEVNAIMKTNYPPTTNPIVYMWIEASPDVTGPYTNANLYTKSMTNLPNLFYRLWISK